MRIMFVLQFYTKLRIKAWAVRPRVEHQNIVQASRSVVLLAGVQFGPVGVSLEVLREGRLG